VECAICGGRLVDAPTSTGALEQCDDCKSITVPTDLPNVYYETADQWLDADRLQRRARQLEVAGLVSLADQIRRVIPFAQKRLDD